MDLSSSNFNNVDIEAEKRNIKYDACLFLVMYCIPIMIGLLVQSPELFLYFTFWYAPYLITAVLGFLTSANEMSHMNCYSCYLKCTLVLILVNIIWGFLYFIAILTDCEGDCEDTIFGSFFALIYAVSAFFLWIFANNHVNNLKDLISRRAQYFQNPRRAVMITNKNQFNPSTVIEVGNTVIEVGRRPQEIPQNYHQSVSQNYQQIPQNYPQSMPQNYPQQIPQNYSQSMTQNYPQQIPQNYSQSMPQNYSQNLPQNYNQSNPQNYPPNNIYPYKPNAPESIEMT